MKLFHSPGSGAFVVEAVLAELGIECERQVVDLKADEQFTARFLAINPRAQVPALLLDDGTVLTESAAIALFLADADSEDRLLPPRGSPARGTVMRWLFFAAANVYEADLRLFYPQRYTSDQRTAPAVKQAAEKEFERCADIIEQALASGPFLLGETMSVFDPYIAMLCEWHWDKPPFFAAHPKLARLHQAVAKRPSLAAIWARNF